MQILTPLWSTAAAHHTIAPSLLVSLSTLAAKSYHVTKEGQVNLKNSYNKIARTNAIHNVIALTQMPCYKIMY